MIRSKLVAYFGCLLIIGTTACDTESCDREPPVIEFDDFEYRIVQLTDSLLIDSLIVKVSFDDCQGDIGIKTGDEGFNLQCFQQDLIDGEWERVVPINIEDTLAFFAKVPYSDQVNEGNRLEGTVEQRFGSVRQGSDTVRFEVRLIDRAGNNSNWVITPPFVLQDY